MRLISYYCDIDGKTFYSDNAKRLKARCDEMGITHTIEERKPVINQANQWLAAECIKPFFIRDMFDRYNEPLLWLDVDCNILKLPDFKVMGQWGFEWRHDNVPKDFVHYIEHTEANRAYLDAWCNEVKRLGACSHTALINTFTHLDYFLIEPGYFELVLAEEVQSRFNYLTKMDALNRKKC